MNGLRVDICTDPTEFERLGPAWEDLLDRSGSKSVFLSWAWLFSWWSHFGASRELRLFLVREPSGRLVGIAPLCLGREGFGATLRVLRFMGTEKVGSDYLDFIAEAGREREVVTTIWHALAATASSWDWIRLTDLLDTSIVLGQMRPLAAAGGFGSDLAPGQICPYLSLPSSTEGFWKILKLGMRNNLRRKVKQLEAVGSVFETTETTADMPGALEEFYRIHALRWKTKGLSGNFHDPRVRAFHSQAAGYLLPRGRMRLYWIRVGDRLAAVLYALEFKGVLSNYQTGFDPTPPHPGVQRTKYSPGVVLIGRCLQNAIEQGLTEFDFLRGPETYKFEWTRTFRRTYDLTLVAPHNLTARARFWALVAERRGKTAVKRLLGRAPISGHR